MTDLTDLEELPERLRVLVQHIELEGYEILERIHLEEGEEVEVKNKSGDGCIIEGKGELYLVFIPDIEENELTPPEFPSDH